MIQPRFLDKKVSFQNNHSCRRCRNIMKSSINNDVDDDGFKSKNKKDEKDTRSKEEETSTNDKIKNKHGKAKYVLGDGQGEPTFWSSLDPVDKSSSQKMKIQGRNQNAPPASSNKPSETIGSSKRKRYDLGHTKNSPVEYRVKTNLSSKTMIANDAESQYLSRALWLYGGNKEIADRKSAINKSDSQNGERSIESHTHDDNNSDNPKRSYIDINKDDQSPSDKGNTISNIKPSIPTQYEDIDLSIPLTVYDPKNNVDLVWDLLRYEAEIEAQREPLLVSFLYSTILNHPSLESSLAFHLANRLSSPSMMSTQIMSLIMEALRSSPTFGRDLRADIMAVRDRDPACTCLPDVFLHFKGFHALETHRVANFFWRTGRKTLAHYLQSQVSQNFQIDIHPNATLRSGIMLDHGTGIVIGETAVVGDNCSILHHVTLGGSGKKGVDRHPKVGNGVLLGAGASVLGNIKIGDGCQVGAGTLVIGDLPPHSVAVGVPAKIIGKFRDEETQPASSMNQVGTKESEAMLNEIGDGI